MLNAYKSQFENVIELLKQEITKLRIEPERLAPPVD